MHHDTSGTAGEHIAVGKRVRYIGNPTMTTWNRPCIGMTGHLTRSQVLDSAITETRIEVFVFEPEIKGNCLRNWMFVRGHEALPVSDDAAPQGEASMFGDCSYEAMLKKAGIVSTDCSRP
jgi:hypothetical protein